VILRTLIFLHRWVGVAIGAVFLLWFLSGIGMMYWTFPGVSAGDRLDRAPNLDPSKITLSPAEAAEKAGLDPSPTQIRLNSFDGRPVYRINAGGGGRGGGGGQIVYADTGELQTEVSPEMRNRIAGAWTGLPASQASMTSVEEVDQWTVAGQFRNLRPLYKYSWPGGEQVYIAGNTGEVVQYTTWGSRLAAHVSAIPHWVYYTPLRKNQPVWINSMIWVSLIGTIGSLLGVIIGVWMYSPKKKYRLAGQPTGIPYRGQKRWHTIIGLVFGIATATWAFSGMLSLDPFPSLQRRPTPPPQQQQQAAGQRGGDGQRGAQGQRAATTAPPEAAASSATPEAPKSSARSASPTGRASREGSASPTGRASRERGGRGRRGGPEDPAQKGQPGQAREGRQTGNAPPPATGQRAAAPPLADEQRPATPQTGPGQRGQQGVAGALRGRVRMTDFAAVHPRDLLAKVPQLTVKELEFTSFNGKPVFAANLAGGKTQMISLDSSPVTEFDRQEIIDIVKNAASNPAAVETRIVEQYDWYYLDRTRQRPLPVILALMNDAEKTRYYIDPKTARVVQTYSSRNWVGRWLYNGLHSLNFPWLYNYRPLWDIVVITFMLGGSALCVTSIVLAWRVLGRKLRRISIPEDVLVAEKNVIS